MAISDKNLKTIYKVITGLLAGFTLVYFSYLFLDIIILLIISIFIAMIFNPLVTLLENQGINRLVSVLLVFAIGGVVIIFGLNVLIPKIVNQINALTNTLSRKFR